MTKTIPSGTRAVVTGAGSGLGRELVLRLVELGARVIVSDLDLGRAEETVALARKRGREAYAVRTDVTKLAEVEKLATTADEKLGGCDLVVNNAGVAVGGPIGAVPIEDWRWVLDVNLYGVIHGCHVFAPRLVAQKSGYVINVASAAGLLNPPQLGPYNVTKAGVVALSETLHAEVGKHGVHVTVLCPTFFRTRIAEAARSTDSLFTRKETIEKLMDQSKIQAPEVARIALEHVARGTLHCLPMAEARMMWRVKRAAPARFAKIMSSSFDKVLRVLSK